jgi:copper chaperone CopZ
MNKLFTMILILGFSLSSAAQMLDAYPEISGAEREVAARTALDGPNTVVLYAKGLCCASCAIGIRKKVGQLSFVDPTRFNQGIELDPKTQLVKIAIKTGQKEDMKALQEAILEAGYDAVQLFKLTKGTMEIKRFASKDTK